MNTTLWDGTIVPVALDYYCMTCEKTTHYYDTDIDNDETEVEQYRCTVCATGQWDF